VGEFIGDRLQRTPDPISKGPLLARLVMGGLVGSIAATSMVGLGVEGMLLGVIGALIGVFGGYMIRREMLQELTRLAGCGHRGRGDYHGRHPYAII